MDELNLQFFNKDRSHWTEINANGSHEDFPQYWLPCTHRKLIK